MVSLPPSIADERFKSLAELVEQRFADLDLTLLLVMLIDNVHESALPALAWSFKLPGDTWAAAPEHTQRRALLKRAIVRRRHKGTVWAIRDALDAIGYPVSHFVENVWLFYDGTIDYDGNFLYGTAPARFSVFIEAEPPEDLSVVARVILDWSRKSTRLDALYFCSSPDIFHDVVAVYRPEN